MGTVSVIAETVFNGQAQNCPLIYDHSKTYLYKNRRKSEDGSVIDCFGYIIESITGTVSMIGCFAQNPQFHAPIIPRCTCLRVLSAGKSTHC